MLTSRHSPCLRYGPEGVFAHLRTRRSVPERTNASGLNLGDLGEEHRIARRADGTDNSRLGRRFTAPQKE
jgi:hypothetical protein